MKLSLFAIEQLVPYVTGDEHPPYRKGPALVKLFNRYGARDTYDFDNGGFPDIGKKNGQKPTRSQYIQHRLKEMSGKTELRELLQQVFSELEASSHHLDNLNSILNPEGFTVTEDQGRLNIEGGIIDKRKPVVNTARFNSIETHSYCSG